jgi:ribosomal protein L37AE/L43A
MRSSSSLASRSESLVCPMCEASRLHPSGRDSMGCESCGGRLSGAMLETLRRICALPDALGSHACEECGHPEMRRLPDGTYHCPACGSEVFPVDAPSTPSKLDEHGVAYWAGWVDGRFGERGSFVDNPNLVKWGNPSDRLTYYRGHRAGSEARRAKNSPNPDDAGEKLFG